MIFNIDALNSPELNDLRNVFVSKGFDMRFVGGCVRDLLIGKDPKDIDLCTDADPQEQVDLYNAAGVRYIETGIDHGTITVILNNRPYEITSLRLDVATDGRRATVKYTKDWIEDSSRRDFTINSMSLTFDGVLIDPFDGYSDLKQGIVRFVGNADERIKEDYLRILRWYRFRGRFESFDQKQQYHPNTKDVMANAAGLKQISKERVWSEIKQIVGGLNGPRMMLEIHQHNCAEHIDLPIRMDYIYRAEELHQKTKNPITILSEMYGGVKVCNILNLWKVSNEEKSFAHFLRTGNYINDIFFLLAVEKQPRDWVIELAIIKDRDPFDIAVLEAWDIPEFPVTGFDLIAAGVKPGPQYTKILRDLKLIWASKRYSATKEELLSAVDLDKYI